MIRHHERQHLRKILLRSPELREAVDHYVCLRADGAGHIIKD